MEAEYGFVKVTRLTGTERVLLMTPTEGYRATSSLTAWRQLKDEDRTQTGYAFEGHYEWTSVVGAWQEEWKQTQPWVEPAHPTLMLKPNASLSFRYSQPPALPTSPSVTGAACLLTRLCVLLSCVGVIAAYQLIDNVRSVDDALVQQGNVSIRAVPGYILSTEMQTAKLYIHPPSYTSEVAFNVSGTGDLTLTADDSASSSPYLSYSIKSLTAGRVHLAVHFPPPPNSNLPPTTAHISLLVLPPFRSHLESLGRFTAQHQWVGAETADPFGRSSSVMPWDFEAGTLIWQDDRSYVAGLSDEAGAGPGLQLLMSQRYAPFSGPLQLLDEYINRTLWGVKTPPEVPYPTSVQNANYSMRASMFWYPGMPNYTYEVRDGWNQERGSELWRAYNYVHPTVLYHSMYRLARDYDGLPRLYSWQWYLQQAYATYIAMLFFAPYYAQFGLMEGSGFIDLMNDLQQEGWSTQYESINQLQQQRVTVWEQLPFPFGSEMPWDSTGQEEIWLSAQAFGSYDLSNSSLSAILAYTHSIPMWAYHGSSRRFWDFCQPHTLITTTCMPHTPHVSPRQFSTHCSVPLFGLLCGAPTGINGKPNYTQPWPERNLHHYGSSLNGKALLRAYEINPDDYYLLEPAIGAMTGVLSNIQPNGAASMGFHADNALLRHDPYDADYGSALYGHVTSASSYYVQHPTFGPSCYLCDHQLSTNGDITITPLDSLHRHVYLEPLGTAVSVDVGRITSVLLSVANRTVVVSLAGSDDASAVFSVWRVNVIHYALCTARPGCDIRIVSPAVKEVRGAWTFPYTSSSDTMTLSWSVSGTAVQPTRADSMSKRTVAQE